jgi:hypothetical protein
VDSTRLVHKVLHDPGEVVTSVIITVTTFLIRLQVDRHRLHALVKPGGGPLVTAPFLRRATLSAELPRKSVQKPEGWQGKTAWHGNSDAG